MINYELLLKLEHKELINIEDLIGNEEKIIEIINKSKVEGMKVFLECVRNEEMWSITKAEEAELDYIAEEIKKL